MNKVRKMHDGSNMVPELQLFWLQQYVDVTCPRLCVHLKSLKKTLDFSLRGKGGLPREHSHGQRSRYQNKANKEQLLNNIELQPIQRIDISLHHNLHLNPLGNSRQRLKMIEKRGIEGK